MQTVVLDGTEYTKASIVAKDFKYTPDYIGQLCRAKKVDAKLVGRTWFVNPKSLTEHKSKKYSGQRSRPASESQSDDKTNVHKVISPVLKSKTAKALLGDTFEESRTRDLAVSYENDQESLIPVVNKDSVTEQNDKKTIAIKTYSSKKIRVKGGEVKNTAQFTTDKLPDVALSGKLAVTPLPEAESAEKPDEAVNKPKIKPIAVATTKTKKKTASPEPKESRAGVKKVSKPETQSRMSRKNAVKHGKVKFSPQSVSDSQPKPVKISLVALSSPLIATLCAVICAGFLFSASSTTTVSDQSYREQVVLQAANLIEIFAQ